MMRKRVLFIANSLDNAYKFQRVLSELGVDIAAGSSERLKTLFAPGMDPDLVIFEALSSSWPIVDEVLALAESRKVALLAIVDKATVDRIQLPNLVPSDFVMNDAGHAECVARAQRLLYGEKTDDQANIIAVDDMAINLATYQVTVSGVPVDFTYLEYSLLTFLVQHPNRTYSRDLLLQSVWGSDYFGSSRTVDVHVRRIRAKLGPKRAQHLETVRGFGYLWNSH